LIDTVLPISSRLRKIPYAQRPISSAHLPVATADGHDARRNVVGTPRSVRRFATLAHQRIRRDLVVAERPGLAEVVEDRPDHVLEAGVLRRLRHRGRVRDRLLGEWNLAGQKDAEGTIGSIERGAQARLVAHLPADHLRPAPREIAPLLAVDVARDRARREAAVLVLGDGPNETAPRCPGRADDRDNLLLHEASRETGDPRI
jgi:hypothetical protein